MMDRNRTEPFAGWRKVLADEASLFRQNAVELNEDEFYNMGFSKWPLCRNANKECSDCPIALHTGENSCRNTPVDNASVIWNHYIDGTVELSTLSEALNKAADWLENEVGS
jgi:hypothetical protein